jgi:SNF2 family DNA or RNA helicase
MDGVVNLHVPMQATSFDVYITTFEIVQNDCEFLKRFPWQVVIIDEVRTHTCSMIRIMHGLFHVISMN